jgi:hypothetical protein
LATPIPRTELSCIQASDIGAPSAENVDFVVIQTHLHFVFDRTQNNQAFHVDTAAGDGRSSAIGGRARGERLNRGGSFGETPAEGRLGRSFLIGTSEAEIVTHDRAIHALRKETLQ